jgi:predicted AlkP superfamily phosphohydrolase/phosphomutase
MASQIRLLVLGLDGATFDVIDKFKDHELPHLKKVIVNGVRSFLESTFPPVTAPAWVSFATGKNPGKTGIFGFTNRISKETYQTKPLTSGEFKRAGTFWDYLSNSGTKVGIWNYPRLYPPYPIKGFMTSGFGCSPYDDFTYPKELKETLLDVCGDYTIHVPYLTARYINRPMVFMTDIMKLLDQNEAAVEFLMEQDIEVFVGIISATDFAQHYMWKFLDETHPLYDAREADRYKPAFLQIWRRIDKIVEKVLTKASTDTDILIVSDHGFGPHKKSFYTNSWLESQGYLFRKRDKGAFLAVLRPVASKAINKLTILSPQISDALKQRGSKYVSSLLNQLNMEKTVAFAAEHASNSGHIYINTLPTSPVQNRKDREQIKKEIAENLRNTLNALDMTVNIYFPEDIYSGEFLHLAPDILFEINDFECSAHHKFGKSIFRNAPHIPTHSGSHKRNGIFIAYGPNIKQGIEIEGTKIYDIAPTILHMFGLPVPDDMDGRVLKEIFGEGNEPAQREVKYQRVDAEREKVKDKIRKLKGSNKL